MKKTVIKLASLVLICCMFTMTLASCGINIDEGKAHVEGLFAAISEEDFKKAATYMHPEYDFDPKDYFEGIAEYWGIKLTDGIVVDAFGSVKTIVYDSNVEGSLLQLDMYIKSGTKSATCVVVLVENDAGFGIYDITVYPNYNG